MSTARPIEIFRAGRHVSAAGEMLAFSEQDLQAAAAAYDPAKHEAPIVIGHPAHDAPAYGWVQSLLAEDGRLRATPRQLDPAFVEAVQAGRWKKISAAFYRPGSPGNPVPDVWYLRHVGFLGAQPPAVKGLAPVELAEDEDGVVLFAEPARLGWLLRSIGSMFRGLRDQIVADKGVDEAERLLPNWQIENLIAEAADLDDAPAYTAPEKEDIVTTTNDAAALASQQAALDEERKKLEAERAALAAEKTKARQEAATAFAENLVGRLTPAQVPVAAAVLAALEGLEDAQPVAFGESGEAKPLAAHFRELLQALPQQVEFRELTPKGNPPALSSDAQAIADAATAYMAEQAKLGNVVTASAAVAHVTKGAK